VSKTYRFHVEFAGDSAAGLMPYSDDISVTVESAASSSHDAEFQQYLSEVIRDWFDGAAVYTLAEWAAYVEARCKFEESAP